MVVPLQTLRKKFFRNSSEQLFRRVNFFSHCCSLRRSRNKRGGRRGSKAARQPFSSFGMHSIRAANHASSLGSFRKHVLQHLHGVAASCANRHFRERPQKDHTFSRKTTHPARGAPPHSYCTGSTSKTKESVFLQKRPLWPFFPDLCQHFSSSTRFAYFCTAAISKF